jgi:SAM-dependent methyltransferase
MSTAPSVMQRLGRISPMRFLEWGHTELYHSMLLSHVPAGAQRALDVGCGTGLFARALAERVAHVDGIDLDEPALALANQRSAHMPNVTFQRDDLLEADLPAATYDFVSCLMCIHHMPFEPALDRLASLVARGGVLVVLGLARMDLRDLPLAAAILPLDVAMGVRFKIAKALGRPSLSGTGPEAPIAGPTMRLDEIREQTHRRLPGARIKRHIFYRYSIVYRAPT